MIRARKPLLLLSSASLLLATACTDPNYNTGTGTDPNQRAKSGAALGGVLGAGLGALVSDDKLKGAVIGGVVGAAGGAVVGSSLDRQAAELRQNLDNDVQITNTGDRLILTMPQDILFDVDSTTIYPGLRGDLLTVAQSLNDYPNTTVQVVGHTDSDGDAGYNQRLSERRANAVADVLLEGGVPFSRVRTFGRGENQPVASNLTEAGKRQNRRVEIVILPNA